MAAPLIYLVIPFQGSPERVMYKMMEKYLQERNLCSTFVPAKKRGAIAQLVEQRTENPCVPGSIPGGTTEERVTPKRSNSLFFCWQNNSTEVSDLARTG